jgi:hypothetical protein
MSPSRLACSTAFLWMSLVVGCGIDSTITASQTHPDARPGQISYDRHSLIINGTPVVLQAAEFHYFRLPSPDLWRDILEKLKAGGFNAVSVYFNWAPRGPRSPCWKAR